MQAYRPNSVLPIPCHHYQRGELGNPSRPHCQEPTILLQTGELSREVRNVPRPVLHWHRNSGLDFRGFSLVGTLATVTILGILLAIGAPQFGESIERTRLKHAAEALSSQLDLVRMETVRRSARLTVSFVTGTNWCFGVKVAADCDCSVPNDCNIERFSGGELSPHITLSSTYSSSSPLVFDQIRGSATNGSLTLATPSGYDLKVILSGRGRIRICSPSGNVPGYAAC